MRANFKSGTLVGLALAIALGGCGGGEEGRGGLSPEEERQLDNAAAMLDDNTFLIESDSMVANEADLLEAETAADANSANAQ